MAGGAGGGTAGGAGGGTAGGAGGGTAGGAGGGAGTFLLTLSATGNGTGTVTSNPTGINCGATCAAPYASGTVVTLTALASANSDFNGWAGGGCSGTGSTCVVTVNAAVTVTATFTLKTWKLTTSVTGGGTLTSTPGAINCGAVCSDSFNDATVVTLNPVAGVGQMFSAWGGACSGSGTCQVTMTMDRTVTATFVPLVFGITVTKTGSTGTGTVTSNVGGINCGATCNAPYSVGTVVTLTATSDASSTFAGWSGGGCSGVGTCVVTVTAATTVNALFTIKSYPLTITTGGNGSGGVSSNPGGINCGSVCNANFNHGTLVSLTASPALGSDFTGWSGACTGLGACVVTMDQARAVTANFTLKTFQLTVNKQGAGGGTVTSAPLGINCGAACNGTFNYNTVVTLTAAPAANSTFAGWSGAGCSGVGTCVVTVDQAKSVNATFDLILLTVAHSGPGFGSVSGGGLGGISACTPTGGVCSAAFNAGTVVTLTAVAENSNQATLSTFGGWSGGGCSGLGVCNVTMNTATTVTANWVLRPNLAFVTASTFNGAFGGLAGGDAACANAATAGNLKGTYRAFITTSTTTAQSRLGTASGWVRVDGKPLVNTPAEAANGNFFYPLRITETGADVGDGRVWTASTTAATCADFTSTTGSATNGAHSGLSSIAINFGGMGCTGMARLYCFGIDRAAAVSITPPSSRRIAFVTTNAWTPGGGIGNADTFCQSEAQSAGLPGTYLAMLAQVGIPASARFNLALPAWTRADGVPLSATASGFFGPTFWDSAPNMNANQSQQFGNYGVWGGAASVTAPGTPATTCQDWMSNAGTGQGGRAGYSFVPSFFGFDLGNPCSATYIKLTCLQQ